MARSPTFSRLFEQHRGPVVRYLRRRLGDDAAEDAAIDVFGQARSRSHGSEHYGSPRSWIYALTTETISERWRTDRSRLERLERLAHQPPVAHPALEAPRRLRPEIAAGLRSLAAVDRETVLLIAWGELTRQDVAATLGIPLDTVDCRLVRAVSQVQDAAQAHRIGGRDDMPDERRADDPDELLAVRERRRPTVRGRPGPPELPLAAQWAAAPHRLAGLIPTAGPVSVCCGYR